MSYIKRLWIWLTLFPIGKARDLSEEIDEELKRPGITRARRKYLRSLYRKAKGAEIRSRRQEL